MKLTLTANAGVIAEVADRAILIDAFHTEKTEYFSSVTQAQFQAVLARFAGREPLLYLTTHDHPDHYSRALTEQAKRAWPGCRFVGPTEPEGLAPQFEYRGVSVDAAIVPHDGAGFESVVNAAYYITLGGKRLLAPGDCATDAFAQLRSLVRGRPVDVALLNFPWLCLRKPREFIENELRPAAVALLHIPFAEDDRGGYRDAVRRSAAEFTQLRCGILQERNQTETF